MANNTVNVERGITGSGAGDDTYIISPALVDANANITISDVEGANQIHLIGGLQIVSSKVAGDTAQLTLSNGAVIEILGASTMSYEIGGNPLTGTPGVEKTYAQFGTDILGVAIPADGTVADGGPSTVNENGTGSGGDPNAPSYTLTAAAATVDEGATATFNLATNNVDVGTVVNYTLSGVDPADVVGGLTGTATIGADGTATITVDLVADVATEGAETLTVSIDGQVANASVTVNDTSMAPTGPVLDLTPDTDSFVGSADEDETFNALAGALQTADTILDASSSDNDVLNAVLDAAGTAPRLQNIETVNINGTYVNTGLDLASVSGTVDLNLNTGITSGTAEVANASTLNAQNINAGANIATLTVGATASGTRDTVVVDAGSASTVNLNGGDGADQFDVTVANGATVVANGGSSIDAYTVNASGATATVQGHTTTEALTIAANNVATTVTIDGEATADYTSAGNEGIVLTGNQDITLVNGSADGGDLDDKSLTDNSTGTSTLKFTSAVGGVGAALDLEAVAVDVVELANAANTITTAVTVNNNSKVNITGGGSVQLNVDNKASDGLSTNTLVMDLSNNVTAVTTGAGVSTVVVQATPDSAADTANDSHITLGTLTANANTNTVVVQGDQDLEIATFANNGDEVISAGTLTGKLTIGTTAGAATIVAGRNDDDITVGAASTVHAGLGDDKVTGSTAADTINGGEGSDTIVGGGGTDTLNGENGNDTITGGGVVDTINGGAGDDMINGAAGADQITLGAGADTVTIAAGEDGDVIADLNVAEDKIILTGSAAGATTIDVTDATSSAGAYTEFGTAHDFTATNVTATDLSDVVQFGRQATATTAAATFTAAASSTLTAGSADDHITAGSTAATIDAGAGNDVLETDNAGTATLTGGAGNDTFNVNGTGTITIKDFGGSDVLVVANVDADVDVDVTTDFTATSATSMSGSGVDDDVHLTLKDGVDVDMTLSTMANATKGYLIETASDVTQGATIVGSRAADKITGSDFVDTITGGEGTDTITGGAGNDVINLAESVTAADTVVVGAASTAGVDLITGIGSGDTITANTAHSTAATAFNDDTSTDYSGQASLTDAATAAFQANDATAFEYGDKTYVVIDLGGSGAGYDATADALIEVTGISGLATDNFIISA